MAASLRCPRLAGEEAVRGFHKEHVRVRENNTTRHNTYLSGARLLQGEGRSWSREPLQRHEGLQRLRPGGRILSRFRFYRRLTSDAGDKS